MVMERLEHRTQRTPIAVALLLAGLGCAPSAAVVVLETEGEGGSGGADDGANDTDGVGMSEADDGADGSTGSEAQCEEWTRLLGGSGDQQSSGVAVVDGQVMVSGWEQRGPEDEGDRQDMFAAGFDTQGELQWMQQGAEMSDERALALAPGPGDTLFVAGPQEVLNPGNDVAYLGSFLTRLDLAGEVVGGLSFPSTPPFSYPVEVRSVAADPAGNAYAVGWTAGPLDEVYFGDGDAFLFRYGADQEVDFVEVIGGPEHESADAVAVAPDGDVIVAGRTSGDLGGGGLVGQYDIWAARYRPDGTREWLRQYGTTATDEVEAVAVGADGSVYLAAVTTGAWPGEDSGPGMHLLLLQLSADGEEQSAVQYTGEYETVVPRGLALDPVGNVYVIVWVLVQDADERDLELLKVDTDGEIAWIRNLGIAGDEDAGGVAVVAEDEVYVSMSVNGTLEGMTTEGYDTAVARLCGP